MKQFNNLTILPFIFILFVGTLLFWPFFLKGLHPFPGNLLLGWHEPWRSDYLVDGRITLPNKPVVDDAFKHVYPLRILSIDMFKKFEFPLWNPYNGAGMPLLAGMNNGSLDPFNILFFFMPYPFAWSIYVILQPLMIGIFMYLYCRKIALSKLASLFSSITFMLSGFVTVKSVFSIYGIAIATLPLLLYLIEPYLQNGITKRIYFIPLLIFAMLVSALPQISLYILVATFSYLIFRLFQNKNKFSKTTKQFLFIVLLFTFGFGLSSLQIFPTLELLQHAKLNVQDSSFIIDKFLVPIEHLISILIPNYFGNEALYNFWGAADYEQTVVAIGLIPSFFAILGLTKNRRFNLQLFFVTTVIISAALAVDWIGSREFFSLPIPILSTAAPTRIFLLTTFAISVLSGFGFDNYLSQKKLSKLFLIKIFLFITIVAAIATITFLNFQNNLPCRFGVVTTCRSIALRNTILETTVFGISLIPFFIYLFLPKVKAIRKIAPVSTLLIITIIGIYNANKFFPYSPKSSFFPKRALVDVLKEKAQYGRVFGIGEANFTPNIPTQLRLYEPQYFHPLYILRYRELLEYSNNGKYIAKLPRGEASIRSESNPNPELERRRNKLLNILGVSHFIFKKEEVPKQKDDKNIVWENEKTYIVKNPHALPRPYLVNSFEVLTSPEELLERLFDKDFDPSKTVLLEESVGFVIPTEPGFAWRVEGSPSTSIGLKEIPRPDASGLGMTREKNQASIETYSENKVAIKTDTNKDSLLVLSDNYYPGWKAYVDDKEIKIYRANYTFRAVEVPKGNHEVKFKYEPFSLKLGASLSFLSLVTLLMLYLMWTKKLAYNHKIS